LTESDAAASLLSQAPIEIIGRFASASNITLLCRVGTGEETLAVYKPLSGETPLWDFPPGTLHRREVAAFLVDRALGWDMVPETVIRDDGPYGPGSLQRFVEHDPERHYLRLVTATSPDLGVQLRRMVAFDIIVNNTDRKASHVLLAKDDRIRLVDHGVCFHEEGKLRTVAWDFAGESVPAEIHETARGLARRLEHPDDELRRRLSELLAPAELDATRERALNVARLEQFPEPTGPRPFPWPPI
jgi:uncharacterized repeat protein (TIGR03843 family)